MTDAAWLRSLRSLSGRAPMFDPAQAPADPVVLFRDWLTDAVDRGVAEPHAMTLATVGRDGLPDARTLILKDFGDAGWAFAGRRSSAKGIQLAAHPVAALSLWWQPLVRAVRVRGGVREATAEESAADLAARTPAARAGIATGDWVLWRVVPERIEFWQGAQDRNHLRLVYRRDGRGWVHRMEDAESASDERETR
ncbi:pyridoxamine 5'-phosphate oxidase family protein [Microbacterium sp. ARD32]|uniref:pyridoxine/pyridoxamine 5'-phosphate oxidase n=1 Tax=Microbacterium sp. ARD32 TaxID=2962577 RepID=UPI002881D340|nr:pyridoxamine 5'-phosphate oxidase family protein [Microbacterium sp. ARD32]MDT0158587.1 pyridoxamine 5'-phosphate oxidase family protein [Microbacterium sp. ARD32]